MTTIQYYAYFDLDGREYILEDEYVEAPLREDMAMLSERVALYAIWGTPDYIDLDVYGRGEPIDSEKSDKQQEPATSESNGCRRGSFRKLIFGKISCPMNAEALKKWVPSRSLHTRRRRS